MTIQVGVLGATGYTGFETVRLLSGHPEVELIFAASKSNAGKRLSDLYPTQIDMELASVDTVDLSTVDVAFLCLPHGASQEYAKRALDAGAVVIDLSADYRLRDVDVYETWYGVSHAYPDLAAEAVYGLTEWRREEVRHARLIANPGCYPTSILLGVLPLMGAGLLDDATIIADSKSGVSGAGRTPKVGSLYVEVNENFKPYSIGHTHRHVSEIEQELHLFGGDKASRGVVFSPHLLPVSRGILSTMYVPLPADWREHDIRALYTDAYADEPFIWLLESGDMVSLGHVVNTNRCAISLHPVRARDQLIVVSAIDNLVKGAAGQAVQNMNVRFGLDETAGVF